MIDGGMICPRVPEAATVPAAKDFGIGVIPYMPLGGGLLTGKYSNGIPEGTRSTLEGYTWLQNRLEGAAVEDKLATIGRLQPVADELDCSLAQLAIAWCLANPDVSTVITGASRPEQVAENMKALEVAEQLTPDVQETLEEILDNRPEGEQNWRGM